MAVQFNEPAFASSRAARKPSFLSRAVIGTGLVKTEGGAQILLFLLAALLILAAAFFFIENKPKALPAPTAAELGNLK